MVSQEQTHVQVWFLTHASWVPSRIMGLILVLIGLLLWLLGGYFAIGIILIVLGLILLFVPVVPGGYHSWGRRGPP